MTKRSKAVAKIKELTPEQRRARRIKVARELLARVRARHAARRRGPPSGYASVNSPFGVAHVPDCVFPAGRVPQWNKIKSVDQKMAMDEFPGLGFAAAGWPGTAWGGGAFAEGITFQGYPYLSYLAQIPEYRLVTEVVSTEATRKWIEFKSQAADERKRKRQPKQFEGELPGQDAADDPEDPTDDKADKIHELEEWFEEKQVRDVFCTMCDYDGWFGRGHLYIDTGDTDQREELLTSIGDGKDLVSLKKITPEHPVKRLIPVEPIWAYPANYNANNPLLPSWYRPESWFCMAQELHSTRFFTFVSRPVPDLLKPSFSFGGLSLSQMVKPAVDNWLETRQAVNAIIKAFSVFVLTTDLGESLTLAGDELFERIDLFNETRSNEGLMVIQKNVEEFMNVSVPLGSLDVLQAQAQEHMASVSRIPLIKLLGISPHGLNATAEPEIRVFNDSIHAYQERFLRPHLTKVFWMAQMSLWGEVDEDITFEFVPLMELSELEKSTLRKQDMETDKGLVEASVLHPDEVRDRIANDPDSPYQDIDPNDVPDIVEEEQEGMVDPQALAAKTPGGGAGGGKDENMLTGSPNSGIPSFRRRKVAQDEKHKRKRVAKKR